jgi:hypothetical protein
VLLRRFAGLPPIAGEVTPLGGAGLRGVTDPAARPAEKPGAATLSTALMAPRAAAGCAERTPRSSAGAAARVHGRLRCSHAAPRKRGCEAHTASRASCTCCVKLTETVAVVSGPGGAAVLGAAAKLERATVLRPLRGIGGMEAEAGPAGDAALGRGGRPPAATATGAVATAAAATGAVATGAVATGAVATGAVAIAEEGTAEPEAAPVLALVSTAAPVSAEPVLPASTAQWPRTRSKNSRTAVCAVAVAAAAVEAASAAAVDAGDATAHRAPGAAVAPAAPAGAVACRPGGAAAHACAQHV